MFNINKGSGRGYLNNNLDPLWEKDTRGPVQSKDSKPGANPSIWLINPEQPLWGPVYHKVVNWQDVGRVKCDGQACVHCFKTRLFNSRRDGEEI